MGLGSGISKTYSESRIYGQKGAGSRIRNTEKKHILPVRTRYERGCFAGGQSGGIDF
jgi:hypothetical protein